MSILSVIDTDLGYIKTWLITVEEELVTIIKAIIQAEQVEITTTIIPLLKSAAVTLQNESPGLNAATFIPALVAAVIPILPVALKDLEVTAISTFASVIAGQLNVPNTTGNAGVLVGGSTNSTPTTTAS
jgi:VIT1/CCC1 family predicted Fe2+/Mn2+ transporter